MSLRVETAWNRPNTTGDDEHWLSVTVHAPAAEARAFAILLDTSASMAGGRLQRARALIESLAAALPNGAEVALWRFSDGVERVPFSTLSTLKAGGKSRLDLGLGAAMSAGDLWLLTDGGPTDARGRRVETGPLVRLVEEFESRGGRLWVTALADDEAMSALCGDDKKREIPALGASGLAPLLAALLPNRSSSDALRLSLCGASMELREAWRADPWTRLDTESDGRSVLIDGSVIQLLLRVAVLAPLGAGRGPLNLGALVVQRQDVQSQSPLALRLVSPASPERQVVEPKVEALRMDLQRNSQIFNQDRR